MRTVIGLDPGAATGYAELASNGCFELASETIRLDRKGEPYSQRLLLLWGALSARLGNHPTPEDFLVCYEQPAQMKGAALIQIAGYLAVIQLFCELHCIASYPVNQSTLKAWAAKTNGHKGKVTKEDMIAWAKAHGAEPTDDNQADAYWLARYGWEMVVPTMGET